MHNFYPTFLDASLSFVYNYTAANFKEDFISALTALVTAQDNPERLLNLTEGAKSILNNETMGFPEIRVDFHKELPEVLKKVKFSIIFSCSLADYPNNTLVCCR